SWSSPKIATPTAGCARWRRSRAWRARTSPRRADVRFGSKAERLAASKCSSLRLQQQRLPNDPSRVLSIQEDRSMFEYRPEHIMSYVATLGKREQLGPVPEGLRVNV